VTNYNLYTLMGCVLLVCGCAAESGPESELGTPVTDVSEAVDALPLPDEGSASQVSEPDTTGSEAPPVDVPIDSEASGDDAVAEEVTQVSTTVTFTTYTDASCTQLPPMNSVVELDTTLACNEAPKASISDVVCYADKITYTNHPNVTGCDSEGFFNELPVGICQEFPGPVPTWKFIEPDTYHCLSVID
jgi:hypothetical protein